MIALGGAAVAGALMIALSFGARVPGDHREPGSHRPHPWATARPGHAAEQSRRFRARDADPHRRERPTGAGTTVGARTRRSQRRGRGHRWRGRPWPGNRLGRRRHGWKRKWWWRGHEGGGGGVAQRAGRGRRRERRPQSDNGPPGLKDSGSAANNPHGGPPGLVQKAGRAIRLPRRRPHAARRAPGAPGTSRAHAQALVAGCR